MKKNKVKKQKEEFNLFGYLTGKALLFVALATEIVSVLIDKGILQGSHESAEKWALAGVGITIIYLAVRCFSFRSSKYRFYKGLRRKENKDQSKTTEQKTGNPSSGKPE